MLVTKLMRIADVRYFPLPEVISKLPKKMKEYGIGLESMILLPEL